ncbi:hypothetical protein GOP47_0030031 [Adiantum capillus-veneris]|nr:hypothetical protein GOP47_0030031 [Adiantum capillus-veneris]
MSTMEPADVCKKGVPEWLNSSLWSSSRSSTSSPRSGPSPPPATSSDQSTSLPQSPLADTTVLAASEPSALDAEDACQVIEQDKLIHRENVLQADESVGNVSNISEPYKFAVQQSTEIVEDECQLNGSAYEKRAPSPSRSIADEESSDIFTTEGPMPSPLSSASSMFGATAATRSSSFDSRVSRFNNELSKKLIQIAELQRLASEGIPDSGSIRAITWKLLLRYLPKSRDDWGIELDKKRAEYASFKEELLVTPSEITRRKEDNALDISVRDSQGLLPRHDITQDDHPLSLGKTSIWHQFFLDSEVCEQIDRDVKRTHPDMHFFCGDSAASVDNQEAMKRVLFIFSKLNPGIRYVQGMNEVLAPLYYVFKTDTDEENSANAEADSFFCFVSLLGDFRDHFVQQLDNSAVGIRSTISSLNELLKRNDEELWRHLEFTSKVNPQFYSFRWITLLLTQEFTFPDSLRLWDSLLGNPEGPLEILLRVCCAMLMSVRSRLLAGDFASNLKLLQRYPAVDIHHLIRVAGELKSKAYSLG